MPYLFVPVEPESRLVDIGCGNGESLAMIRENMAVRWLLLSLIQNGGHRLWLIIPVEIALASAEDLPFEAATFDIALAECSVSLFMQPAVALNEIHRVLMPGGN